MTESHKKIIGRQINVRNIPEKTKAKFKAKCAMARLGQEEALILLMENVNAGIISLPEYAPQEDEA